MSAGSGRAESSSSFRLTRRRVLRGGALLGAVLSVPVLACSARKRPPSSAAGAATPAPRRGGVLGYAGGMAGSADTLGLTFDPVVQTQYQAKTYGLFYERLVGYDVRSYAVQPELAQSWEQPSSAEYVFHLQQGVKWHRKPPVNGRALTADDIVWTLQRARTDDPKFYSRALLDLVDKIEAPSPTSIRITTKAPDASTLSKLSADNLFILAREVLEKFPKPLTADSVVGTGPFVMTAVEEKVSAEYSRNDDYWKPGLPYLDGFRTRDFPDAQTAWAAFLAGQVDVARVPGVESKKYIAQQGSGYTPGWKPADAVAFQYPNLRVKPMNDARVTRALRLLINHDEFITACAENQYGEGGYGSVFPAALSAWDLTPDEFRQHLEWKQPKDDAIKEALSLLAAAGFSKDNPLRFTLNSAAGVITLGATLSQAQWRQLGQGVIDTQLKPTDTATTDSVRASSSFTYAYYGHSTGMVEPDSWLSSSYRSGGSLNFMGLSDPTLDAMIDKQRATFDDAQRRAVVKEIIGYVIEHGPSTIPSTYTVLDATQPKVRGYVPEYAMTGSEYRTVWMES